MIEPSTLHFLQDLRANNYREWYHAHKSACEAARNNVLETASEMIVGLNHLDPSIGYPDLRKCMFRIARDTRFSPDKTPYKTHIGLVFSPEGNTHCRTSVFYLHIEPGGSMLSGGLYMPDKDRLKAVREAIVDEWDTFSALVHAPSFHRTFGDLCREEKTLKRVPAGFDKDFPGADYLKLTSFYVYKMFSDDAVCHPSFVDTALRTFKQMAPLHLFLNHALQAQEPSLRSGHPDRKSAL